MLKVGVTEQEIEKALALSAHRDFSASLELFEGMLVRAQNDHVRMKILFGIIICSTWLGLNSTRDHAIEELKKLPDYEISHAFVVRTQVNALVDSGRAQEALDLINANIESAMLKKLSFRIGNTNTCSLKGAL